MGARRHLENGLNCSAKFSKSLLGWCEAKVHLISFAVPMGMSLLSCTRVIAVKGERETSHDFFALERVKLLNI